MKIDLNLKCGGKVTRVEVLKDDKIVRTIDMNSHNHIVSGGRDYICTWRGDNQMPYKGLWSTDGYSVNDGCHEVITGLNMLYGFPNVQNNFGYSFQQNGDTIVNDNISPLNNRSGQIGPLTFGKIGVSDAPTNDSDTNLHAPISNLVIDSYNNGTGWHGSKIGSDNTLSIRTAYSFKITEDCTIKEFGTFGKYAPTGVSITTSNYNSESIYTNERMFSRTVLEHPVSARANETVVVIYEFTIQFPSKQEVVTTLAGHDCVRSFHLPAKNSGTVLDRWYALTANCDNLPIGFITTRNHSVSSSGTYSKSENTVSNTIDNSSCFPLCSFRFCCNSTRASNYNKNYTRGINACSALGMSPIAYIEDCTGAYSSWYRQCLRTEDANGKLRNMLADCATYTHTMEDYVPGTGYRIHTITLGSFATDRPRVYGIGLMGFIYRFGHYEDGQFITEPISIPAGSSISYKVKLQISNIDDEEGSESEESSGS